MELNLHAPRNVHLNTGKSLHLHNLHFKRYESYNFLNHDVSGTDYISFIMWHQNTVTSKNQPENLLRTKVCNVQELAAQMWLPDTGNIRFMVRH